VLGGLGLYVRIRAEERQLTQALGDEYEHFAAGRKRLVPRSVVTVAEIQSDRADSPADLGAGK
jgi:hypothetical protein